MKIIPVIEPPAKLRSQQAAERSFSGARNTEQDDDHGRIVTLWENLSTTPGHVISRLETQNGKRAVCERVLDSGAAPLFIKAPMAASNRALGHIVLNVRDLKRSENFYRSILGLKVSARNRETKMTFLSFGREHHDVALQALPKGAKLVGGRGMPKLHHFCIYVDRNEEIDKLYRVLKRRKIPIVSGPETLVVAGNRSISFLDPDGNRLELACNANKFRYDERTKEG